MAWKCYQTYWISAQTRDIRYKNEHFEAKKSLKAWLFDK